MIVGNTEDFTTCCHFVNLDLRGDPVCNGLVLVFVCESMNLMYLVGDCRWRQHFTIFV